jgi:hypothetical protein
MAYVSKQLVQRVREELKQVCKDYGIKVSVAGTSGLSLKITIASGKLDFIGNYNKNWMDKTRKNPESLSINQYWYKEQFSGKVLECIEEILRIANQGNHDRSDIMTDYFDVGWYVDLSIGRWDKPYVLQG